MEFSPLRLLLTNKAINYLLIDGYLYGKKNYWYNNCRTDVYVQMLNYMVHFIHTKSKCSSAYYQNQTI